MGGSSGTLPLLLIVAGGLALCAVFASGGVYCWGSNGSGQLGDGSQSTPGVGGDLRPLGDRVPVLGR